MNIRSELKAHFKYMILSFAFALTNDVMALIPPVIMSVIIDSVIPNKSFIEAIPLIVLFIALPVINGCVYAFYNTWGAMMCRKASYRINSKVIESILWQPMRFHTEKSSATLATECSRSAIDYTYIWVQTIPQTAATVVTSVIAFVYLFMASKWMAVSQLVLIPVLLIPTVFVRKLISKYSKTLFGAVNAIQAMLIESFRAIKTVKTFCLEKTVLKKYAQLFSNVDTVFKKEVWIESFQGNVASQFIMSVFLGIAFVVGAYEVSSGLLTIGVLVSALTFIGKYQNGVMSIMTANLNFAKQLSTFEPLFQYQSMAKEGGEGKETPSSFLKDKFEIRDLTFSYDGEKNVLEHFNLTIPGKSWIGINGHSGIGKTTLLDILTRIEKSENAVFLDGMDIAGTDIEWYRSHIAVVTQFPYIFNDTVRNNFRLVNENISDDDIDRYLGIADLREVISALPEGLETQLGEDAQQLSGGEKQRLALAIALASKRSLLVLDEATSNLDADTEKHIASELNKFVRTQDLTIISVSHRAAFHEYCDNIISLD